MNVGVLGSGFMGGTHARAYAKLPDVKVVTVFSQSLEKAQTLADEVGARPTTAVQAILEDPTIDAISVALPTHLHKPLTLAALQAGKHVLVEKPFALTVADCDEMIAAQQQSGKLMMVGQVLRFWPEYRALIDFVHSGAIGQPLSAIACRLSQAPAWSDWFRNPAQSGGAVIDLMIHDIDALNWVMGAPISVYARGQLSAPQMWDHILTLIDYGDAQASIEASELLPAGYPFTMGLIVLGKRGRVEYHFKAGGVSVEMGNSINTLLAYEPNKIYPLDITPGDAWEAQIAYFVDCVRTSRAPEVGTPQQARLAVAMANAARQSLETGEVIRL
jgi:UDP-N-acetylglucosamine 3-dehydrogenase